MTALCGGAASQSKPGVGVTVVMTGGAIAALLNNVPTPWAVAFGTLLAGVTYDLTTMCASDPPALVAMTGQDMLDLTSGPAAGVAYVDALAKFYSFVKYWAWFQFCECSTVATPAPSAPPASPANLPTLAPPIGVLTPAQCWDKIASARTANGAYNDITAAILPPAAIRTGLPGGSAGITVGHAVPAPLPLLWTMTLTVDAPATAPLTLSTTEWDSAGVASGAHQLVALNAGDTTLTLTANNPFSANTAFFAVYIRQGGVGAAMNATAEIAWKCQPSTTPPAPCCPPDPIASGLLTQILQAVTLIQRQAVPFAYLAGTAHAGLSGSGTLAISGLLGAKISITTLPTQLGQTGTLPVEIFDAGFITFSTPDGYPQSHRIAHNPQLLLPARCSAYTQLNYDLHPGVVATITELVREP